MPSEPPKAEISVVPPPAAERASARTWRAWAPDVLPLATTLLLLVAWDVAIRVSHTTILPGPIATLQGLGEITRSGVVFKYTVASLFRVTWGYGAAVCLAIPLGLTIGWFRRAELATNPLLQMLRPISPLAWIPIAILWFGVGDQSAIFIIFLGSFFPLLVAAMNSVSNVSRVHLNVGRNFGMSSYQLLRHIVFPAVLPQLVVGMRLALGVAWLVVVAAEMIAVDSGLGYLIIEARNAGGRYDLVVGGMVLIGTIGLLLDALMRRLERAKALVWSYAANASTETIRHAERRRRAR